MIDWLLTNHHHFVKASRWIIAGCAAALMGIASLPRTPIDRVVALIGVVIIGLVFIVWLGIALLTILRPRISAEMRQRRASRALVVVFATLVGRARTI